MIFSSGKKFSRIMIFLQKRGTGEFEQFRCETPPTELIPDFSRKIASKNPQKFDKNDQSGKRHLR
ncbi:MAG: hypothetical protein LBJ03_03445 [Holosporales bacterium]|nr:hypothetical protein [Holosporales bacterium]